jgi:hypothetical protein
MLALYECHEQRITTKCKQIAALIECDRNCRRKEAVDRLSHALVPATSLSLEAGCERCEPCQISVEEHAVDAMCLLSAWRRDHVDDPARHHCAHGTPQSPEVDMNHLMLGRREVVGNVQQATQLQRQELRQSDR